MLTFGIKGFIDEYNLVQMMWPGLIQPETDEPWFKVQTDNTVFISCNTEGASIAYQINDEIGQQSWNLYHKPLKLTKGDKIVSQAVRIGYKTSNIESVELTGKPFTELSITKINK